MSPLSAASGSFTGDKVDNNGNNVAVKNLLDKMQNDEFLSRVAESGLLSKAQAAGITLSKLEPLLQLAAAHPDILILVEASGPELLPVLPIVVDLAPFALPLVGASLPVLGALGVVVVFAAVSACAVLPDDSLLTVALQTLIVALALPAASAAFAGAALVGNLKK